MRTSLLSKNTILAGASVLAFAAMASAGFAQDGGEGVIAPEDVVSDDPTGWVEGDAGLPDEGVEIPAGDEPPLDEDTIWIDDPIEWIDPGVIGDGGDIPVYEEYPVIDGEILPLPESVYSDADCGGCEFYTMGGGAAALDQGSSGGSSRISVAPQTIDMCLTEAWKNLWICRIQAGAAQH